MKEPQARALLDAKLALEAELIKPLLHVLVQYVHEVVKAEGHMTPAVHAEHTRRVELLLQRHYARTVMVVTGRKPPYSPDISEAALSLAHAESLHRRAQDQAKRIIATIDKRFKTGMAQRISAGHVEDGTGQSGIKSFEVKADPPPPAVPSEPGIVMSYILDLVNIAKMITQKLGTAIGGIANVQTNGPAEEARQIEAQQKAREQAQAASRVEVVDDGKETHDIIQIWHNVGDTRVRGNPANPRPSKFDHWSAEGQEQPVDKPFVISGELLRFPSDMALGASLANCIQCRCFIESVLVNRKTGERTSIHTAASEPTRRIRRPTDRAPEGATVPHLTPTSSINLGSRRGKIVLANRQIAGFRTEKPGLAVFTIGKQTIGRITYTKDGITSVQIAPGHAGKGMEELIKRSIEAYPGKLP